jgi:hypothetical protein
MIRFFFLVLRVVYFITFCSKFLEHPCAGTLGNHLFHLMGNNSFECVPGLVNIDQQ